MQPDTDTLTRPQPVDTGKAGLKAHIVDQREHDLTDAYVFDLEVTALCGFKWRPSRDPKGLPICEICKDIAAQMGEEYSV